MYKRQSFVCEYEYEEFDNHIGDELRLPDCEYNPQATYSVEVYDEILATWEEARKQMNEMRLSRGFYPIVALVPTAPNSSSRGKGKRGKGSRSGKGAPKTRRFVRARRSVPGGKSQAPGFRSTPKKGKGRGSKSSSQSVTARGKAAGNKPEDRPILCARCGQEGHTANICPIPGNAKKRQREDMMVIWDCTCEAPSVAAVAPLEAADSAPLVAAVSEGERIDDLFLQNNQEHPCDAVLDAGAQSFVCLLYTSDAADE